MEAGVTAGTVVMAVESYGVRLDIRLDDASLMPAVRPLLPPGWREAEESPADVELALVRQGGSDSRFAVLYDAETIVSPVDLDIALRFLEERIRGTVAVRAPDRIFIHAGVVAHEGRAVLLPADSFAGKTTLVAALVAQGAAYYSDEFAVVDPEGRVHPYPKLLSIRGGRGEPPADVPASELGGSTGHEPVPVALVALTSYRQGAVWDPKPLDRGASALALLSHTIPARQRPDEALHAVRKIAENGLCVASDRGEAEPVARELLAEIAQ